MSKVHVKTGDTVYVLSGKDRGKTGKVLAVNPAKNRVMVEGVAKITKAEKPKSQIQPGGITVKESFIDASNVLLVCPKCGKGTKVGKEFLANGDKARVCKKCGEVIDIIVSKGND